MIQTTYEQLDQLQRNLLEEAKKAMRIAYNPYSRFSVGASLLSQNGQIVSASNVENAAYGSTICAERGAIMRANAMGIRMFDMAAIIATGENFDTTEVTGPCGSCRQMLFEAAQISGKDLEIILSTTQHDKIVIATINELLPLGFGPRELGVDVERYRH